MHFARTLSGLTVVLALTLTGCTVLPTPDAPRGAGAFDVTVTGADPGSDTPSTEPEQAATSSATTPDNSDVHLLLLSGEAEPLPAFLTMLTGLSLDETRVGYIGDAASPYRSDLHDSPEYERLSDLGVKVVDIALAGRTPDEVSAELDGIDALYVGGGNTFALLDAMRASGADQLIAARVRRGMPYIGLSAGAIVTGPSIVPASVMDDPADAPDLDDTTGLGLISSIVVPHASGDDVYSTDVIQTTVDEFGDEYPLTLLTDDEAIVVSADDVRVIPPVQ